MNIFKLITAALAIVVLTWVLQPTDSTLAQNVACYREQGGARVVAGNNCDYDFVNGSDATFAAGSDLTLQNGSRLDLQSGSYFTATGNTTLSGTTTVSSLEVGATGFLTASGTVVLSGTTTASNLEVGSTGFFTSGGTSVLSGTTTVSSLEIGATGFFTSNGTAVLSGTTTVDNGSLTFTSDASLVVTPASVITVTNGGVLTPTASIQPIAAAGPVTVTLATGAFVDGQKLTIINTVNQTIIITDAGSVFLSGNQSLGQNDTLEAVKYNSGWYQTGGSNN